MIKKPIITIEYHGTKIDLIIITEITCECNKKLSYCEVKKNGKASCLHEMPHCDFFSKSNIEDFYSKLTQFPNQLKEFNEYLTMKKSLINDN